LFRAKKTRRPTKVGSPQVVISETSIRVTVEVIVRHDYPGYLKTKRYHEEIEAGGSGCP